MATCLTVGLAPLSRPSQMNNAEIPYPRPTSMVWRAPHASPTPATPPSAAFAATGEDAMSCAVGARHSGAVAHETLDHLAHPLRRATSIRSVHDDRLPAQVTTSHAEVPD